MISEPLLLVQDVQIFSKQYAQVTYLAVEAAGGLGDEWVKEMGLGMAKRRFDPLFLSLPPLGGFWRYFFNTSWLFAEQVLRIIAGLLVGIYVARYLGPEQFGAYSYALAFVALFAGIGKLGLDGIVVRDLVNHPQERDVFLGTAFWLKLAGVLFTMGLLTIAVQFADNDAIINLYIYIVAIGLIFQSFEVVDFYFQSKVLSKYVSLCKISQLTLSSALKLYFVFIQAELLWFVIVTLVDQVSLALALAYAYWRQKNGGFFRQFHLNTAKKMLRNSWPLILSGIAVSLYMRIDQIMIKEMLGEREVGLYSAAVRLSEMWYFLPSIIVASLFPAIVNAKKISEELYHERLLRLCTFMTWLAIVVAIPATYLADWLVTLLFGALFQPAGGVLAIHIWGAVFVFMGMASGVFFTTENLTRKPLYRTVAGAIANVLLNIVLIPRYGINGAAVATVASQILTNYLYDLFDCSTRRLLVVKTKSLLPIHLVWKQYG